jgi:hypothetical protein
LNDPIKGITALQRVGVSFTKSQKDQIKTLVDSGKTLDAQKLILRELGKEFGGAAEASADPLQKLGVVIKNLEEKIGLAFLPTLNKVADFIGNTFIPTSRSSPTRSRKDSAARRSSRKRTGSSASSNGSAKPCAASSSSSRATRSVLARTSHPRSASKPEQAASLMKTLKRVREVMLQVVDFVEAHWKPILIGAGAVLLALTGPVIAIIAGLVILYVKFKAVREAVAAVAKFVSTCSSPPSPTSRTGSPASSPTWSTSSKRTSTTSKKRSRTS